MTRFDLLRVPLVGPFLASPRGRPALQVLALLVALVLMAHGFFGPALAAKNLATLVTWVHFRGLVVLVLLAAGNFFCMACPFMLPRALARRLRAPARRWPLKTAGKWPGLLAFVAVLFVYELFDLWGEPWWTAFLIAGYFATALAVDAAFQHAAFCKYLCPVGQFNFVGATLAPLEVAVREPATCGTCRTADCIRGGPRGRGCELALFQPRKVGNLDCTFCLDCVYACPHDNVGILSRLPGDELADDRFRSGVGRWHQRADWTALIVVFTFGALLNAFAMISPVYALEQALARATGLTVEWPILLALFAVALGLLPALLLGAAGWLSRPVFGHERTVLYVVNRFARCLVPLGFGMWLAHYGFHFFTGFLTLIPVTQAACGVAAPSWHLVGLPERMVLPMEMGFLGLGALGSLVTAYRIAGGARRAFAPWAALIATLFAAAVWIMNQPMDMRGVSLGG